MRQAWVMPTLLETKIEHPIAYNKKVRGSLINSSTGQWLAQRYICSIRSTGGHSYTAKNRSFEALVDLNSLGEKSDLL